MAKPFCRMRRWPTSPPGTFWSSSRIPSIWTCCRGGQVRTRRLNNGAKWRSIPAELGDRHHAYLRFRRWADNGVWDKIMAHVVAEGEPKLAFACIDGTVARAHQKAAGARPSKLIR